MDFVTSVTAGMTAVKQIKDLFDVVQSGKHQLELQTAQLQLTQALFEIQQSLMNVQNQNVQLHAENQQLQDMVNNKKNWENISQNYQLHRFATDKNLGSTVYKLKEHLISEGNPSHYICPHCFENQTKSIIQAFDVIYNGALYRCPCCKNEFRYYNGNNGFDCVVA